MSSLSIILWRESMRYQQCDIDEQSQVESRSILRRMLDCVILDEAGLAYFEGYCNWYQIIDWYQSIATTI